MKKLLFIIMTIALVSCASAPKRTEFICVADLNRDSRCSIVPCSAVNDICKAGKYRILKNYVTGYAYVYSTDPLTDMKSCQEAAKGE
jgi:hypothetical protein